MGKKLSKEEEEQREKEVLERFRGSLKDAPDIRVDQNIQRFTGLSSTDSLRQHYQQRSIQASDVVADWMKNLAEKLAALTPAAELAGLGALAIAVFIDVSFFSPPEESTKEALRSVFAEEKVSKVRDLVDECLRRTMVYINQREKLVSTMKELERQLSATITSLKNSMVKDGHMSSQSLRVWVNAAAFHIHMLIHLVRLGGLQTSDPAERLLDTYQSDLVTLLTLHEKMVKEKCEVRMIPGPYTQYLIYLRDEESDRHQIDSTIKDHSEKYFEVYYDQRYGRQQRDIQQYFTTLREELPRLVQQTGTFP